MKEGKLKDGDKQLKIDYTIAIDIGITITIDTTNAIVWIGHQQTFV